MEMEAQGRQQQQQVVLVSEDERRWGQGLAGTPVRGCASSGSRVQEEGMGKKKKEAGVWRGSGRVYEGQGVQARANRGMERRRRVEAAAKCLLTSRLHGSMHPTLSTSRLG